MPNSNVIVFFTDQQRADTTGVGGNPCGLTPNFDRVAMSGTYVTTAVTPQPVCGPARAVLQTGKYATCTGNYRNAIPLAPEQKTMAHYFNEAGYDTAYIGKWHLASGRREVKEEERGGYQYWLGANALEATSRPYDTLVYDNDNRPVKLPGHRIDALTDAAIRYIDGHSDSEKPFFLFLSFLEPHFQNCFDDFEAPHSGAPIHPLYVPPDLGALGGTSCQHLGGYYGMVKRLDEAFGRIRDALESLNLTQETILVFTSDHGCHFKTRNAEYKRSCHESSIRIPLAFYGAEFTGGGNVREIVSLLDLAPTLLDACGIAVPDEMQGHSMMPIVRRQPTEWENAALIQISEAELGRAIRTERWKYAIRALDKDPIVDSHSDTYTEMFLYDLEHDPYELNNLIHSKAHEPVCAVLREKLTKLMEKAGEAAPTILAQPKEQIGQLAIFSGEENR